jgi:hypothetical protein
LTTAFAAPPNEPPVTPLNKINDLGQILVTVGSADWGVLTPSGGAAGSRPPAAPKNEPGVTVR